MQLPWQLLQRKADSHKGDFGHIFILAGSNRYSGAAVLCAEATLRSGAGIVTLGIPKNLNNPIIKIKPKEVITLPLAQTKEVTLSIGAYKKIKGFVRGVDVLVIGPGLSRNKSTQSLARKVIKTIKKPMVIDADGLNALIGHLDLLTTISAKNIGGKSQLSNRILTPHPGEDRKSVV